MSKKTSGLGKFICGLAVGAGLGILFAPKSGKETRQDLMNKANEIADYIKNIDKEDVKRQLTEKINELKKELKELDKEKIASIAKEQANKIVKKADELITLAKEKAEPVVEKAAKELKAKAVSALKSTAEKIENSESNTKKKEIK